jgi:hypothetical protein
MVATSSMIDWLEDAKWVFVVIYVVSTIGVAIGVYWEGDHFPKARQQAGWKLLLACLGADTLLTILIFAADGGISHIQRAEIISLNTRIAPRSLTTEQQKTLAESFAKFPGKMVSVSSYMMDIEGDLLGKQILHAVSLAKLPEDDARMRVSSFGSVMVGIAVTGTDSDFVAAATATFVSLGLTSVSHEPSNNFMDSIYEQKSFPLKIFIGAKPLVEE